MRLGNKRTFHREVVYIERHDGLGAHGGSFWGLWLCCGHYATRSIPGFKFWRLPPLAPKKVHCIHCEDGMAPMPLPHDLFARRVREGNHG